MKKETKHTSKGNNFRQNCSVLSYYKNRSRHQRNAKYYKNDLYYCNIHSKNSKFLKPTEEIRTLNTKIKKTKKYQKKN